MLPYNKIIVDDEDMGNVVGNAVSSLKRRIHRFVLRVFKLNLGTADDEFDDNDSDCDEGSVVPAPTIDPITMQATPPTSQRKRVIRNTILKALGRTASSSNLVVAADSHPDEGSGSPNGAKGRHGLAPSPKRLPPVRPSLKMSMNGSSSRKASYRLDNKRMTKDQAYGKNVAQKRKQSIVLGDRRPRRQSTRLGSPSEETLNKEQKLALINQKYQANKILSAGDNNEEMCAELPPLRTHSFTITPSSKSPRVHPVEEEKHNDFFPTHDDVHCFDNDILSAKASNEVTHDKPIPARVFKNVTIADMLGKSGSGSDNDWSSNDDDCESEPGSVEDSRKMIDNSDLGPNNQPIPPHASPPQSLPPLFRHSSSKQSMNSVSIRSLGSIAYEEEPGGTNMMVNLESTIVAEHRGEVDDSDEEENRDKLTLNHSGPGPTMDGPPPSVLGRGGLASLGSSFKNSLRGMLLCSSLILC